MNSTAFNQLSARTTYALFSSAVVIGLAVAKAVMVMLTGI